MTPSSVSPLSSCRIVWSTQTGRAKACARRTARILGEKTSVKLEGGIGSPFDEMSVPFLKLLASPSTDIGRTLILMFVSTTGDGEQCDSIRNTWKSLLQKSLPKNLLAGSRYEFALFCLGDRAYGPQFCAGGRKLAVRLLQLGLPSFCEVGYGDDNTPNGGVFRDLDDWLEGIFLPKVLESTSPLSSHKIATLHKPSTSFPYRVQVLRGMNEKGGSDLDGDILTDIEGRGPTSDQDERKEEPNLAEWETEFFKDSYREYFKERAPSTAYSYGFSRGERIRIPGDTLNNAMKSTPLLGSVVINERITDSDWKQNTRHLKVELMQPESQTKGIMDHGIGNEKFNACNDTKERNASRLPYMAGDVASVLPFNSRIKVNQFLSVLPDSISSLADSLIRIDLDDSYATDNRYTRWPRCCTLRGWLTYCADIQSLPEREDLRVLSTYCAPGDCDHNKDKSLDQSDKLRSFSETSGAALYADYILREKRSWIDLFHDFESLREPGSRLTIEALLMILPSMRTRDFSIASAPSMELVLKKYRASNRDREERFGEDSLINPFSIELCVAVVEGTTRLGRSYHGLCSKFLSGISPFRSATAAADSHFYSESTSQLLLWIRPGTFGRMPVQFRSDSPASFEVPIIFVGAGTGIAPMRSLILERAAIRFIAQRGEENDTTSDSKTDYGDMPVMSDSSIDENENVLVFGCRKKKTDYYYEREWETLRQDSSIRILTAFSQDQQRKIYVQKVLRDADDGLLIVKHILERGGAIYIAGNPKMARAVKQEIVEVLSDTLPGGEKQTNQLLKKMQRIGRFNVEAWS